MLLGKFIEEKNYAYFRTSQDKKKIAQPRRVRKGITDQEIEIRKTTHQFILDIPICTQHFTGCAPNLKYLLNGPKNETGLRGLQTRAAKTSLFTQKASCRVYKRMSNSSIHLLTIRVIRYRWNHGLTLIVEKLFKTWVQIVYIQNSINQNQERVLISFMTYFHLKIVWSEEFLKFTLSILYLTLYRQVPNDFQN